MKHVWTFLFFAALILLGACGANSPFVPQIQIKEVPVPTAVRCKPDIGPEPDYPKSEPELKAALNAAPDLFTRVQLLLSWEVQRIARDQVKSAALAGCAG